MNETKLDVVGIHFVFELSDVSYKEPIIKAEDVLK